MPSLLAAPFSYFADANGAPLAGGKVYTYVAGSGYATPKATYTDSTGGTQAANPVVLDSAGRAQIWLAGSYGIVVKDSLGNVIESTDPVIGTATTSAIPWAVAVGTADAITATYNPPNTSLTDGLTLAIRASAANATNAPTFAPDGLTAYPITMRGGASLVPGNIVASLAEYIVIFNLANTRWELLNPSAVGVFQPQGRLTLVSGTPVLTADETAQTTVYYTPYIGNSIPLSLDGTTLQNTAFAELSLALDSGSGHTGYHQSGKLFDLFVYNDSGTSRLVTGPAWTNTTTRAQAISMLKGVWVNTLSMVAKFDTTSSTKTVAAKQGICVGTMYATADGQTGVAFKPSPANGGTNNIIGLFNAYNRIRQDATCRDNTASWTYATGTWRVVNAGGTGSGLNNRISILDGLGVIPIVTRYQVQSTSATAGNVSEVGVNLNSTSAAPGIIGLKSAPTSTSGDNIFINRSEESFYPSLGFNYYQAMEYSNGNTETYNGSAANAMALTVSTEY